MERADGEAGRVPPHWAPPRWMPRLGLGPAPRGSRGGALLLAWDLAPNGETTSP